MAEYIEREAVVKAFCESCSDYIDNKCTYEGACETSIIATIPAADVQPVKHGYWEEVNDYNGWGDTHYRCSVCGEEWDLEDGKPKDNNMNFCPRCGTKMDAEPDEPWQSD